MKSSAKKLPPYGKQLIARRIAHDHPGLVVVATGFNEGLYWADRAKVSRIVVPMDSDPATFNWYLMLVDLDVLIAPGANVPDEWLTLLTRHVWKGEPRMVWMQDDEEVWRLWRPEDDSVYPMEPFNYDKIFHISKLGRAIHLEVRLAQAVSGAMQAEGKKWTPDQWFS